MKAKRCKACEHASHPGRRCVWRTPALSGWAPPCGCEADFLPAYQERGKLKT